MTARRQAFVAHYLATLNAADAARKAGYVLQVVEEAHVHILSDLGVVC